MTPLISCIMPTSGKRKRFVEQAIKLFNAQDYPNKELVIVDELDARGNSCVSVWQPQRNIEYLFIDKIGTEAALTIGAKRNLACSLAKGDIICHWDDDDYYGPERLSQQVEPLLHEEAQFSAMRMSLLLDASKGTLWTCDDCTHRQLFKQDVHYGTLMYWASYWHGGTHFTSANVGEDVRFTHAMLAQGARLARIVDPASFIYVLHGGNSTNDMRIAHPNGWQQVPLEDYLTQEHRGFYEGMSDARTTNRPATTKEAAPSTGSTACLD